MKRNLEQMEQNGNGEGNTNPPQLRVSQAKRWAFTFNNYTMEQKEQVEQRFRESDIAGWIFQEEIGDGSTGDSAEGTPHLQGYFEFKEKGRWSQLKLPKEIHFEKAKGNKDQNITYCSKLRTRVAGTTLYSENFTPPKPKRELVKLGREWLRPDQCEIVDMFKDYEDPLWGRKIYWFWEPKGNWGKSVTATHMVDYCEAIEVSGAAKDVFFGIASALEERDIKTVILDIPRESMRYVQYQAIEKIKDGKFFSPKYESGMIRFNKPHIVVFANEPPDYGSMSMDRWVVQELGVPPTQI